AVAAPDHRAFAHALVPQQRLFHLGAGNVVAGADDHVVGARVIPEIAGGIGAERVAGEVPAVADIFFLPLVVEITAAGRTTHRKPPDLARRDIVHVFINN